MGAVQGLRIYVVVPVRNSRNALNKMHHHFCVEITIPIGNKR